MPEMERPFREGDYVEIVIRGSALGGSFGRWNGRRGYVVGSNKNSTYYLLVRIPGDGRTGWWPHQLRLIDTDAEAAAILGDEYFR